MKVKVVVDVEMCRVQTKSDNYPHKNEIIQIGAVMMDESYKILSDFATYVKPRFGKINNFIWSLTGISDKDIKDAPDIEESLLKMLQWIGDNEVVFYSWSPADYYQIRKEIQAKCQDDSRWTVLLDRTNWIDYQRRLGERLESTRCIKLSDALDLAEVDTEGHMHDGHDDAYNTARMIAKLELQKDYRTLIEQVREKEANQKPLTASFGNLFQGLSLEFA